MDLPILPPVKPMLAKAIDGIPTDGGLLFEPKWDGFRCIVFRSGDDIVLGSRNEKPLTRYFPEMLDPLRAVLPPRCVVDGELIVSVDDHLEFDVLQQRIHPAESRVNKLAAETPAAFVAFDLLAEADDDLRARPFGLRRERLESALASGGPQVHLTPATEDPDTAAEWFTSFEGAGLDGLIAKPLDGVYAENKRAQFKVKHVRTADAVVAGYRRHKDGQGVGSLLLGLFDGDALQHVGVAASFSAKRRVEFLAELAPLEPGAVESHPWRQWAEAQEHADGTRMPGAPHRWNAAKDSSWVPLRIERVAEVKYGSTLNGRFREVTNFRRWRPDKTPNECTFDQLQEPVPLPLSEVLQPSGAALGPIRG